MNNIGKDGQRRLPVVGLALACLFAHVPHRAWGAAAACAPAASSSCPTPLGQSLAKPSLNPRGKVAAKTKVSASAAPLLAGPPPGSFRATLDPLQRGGWVFISDGPPENPSAVYASSHGVQHVGNVVTAWIRWEFARPQAEVYPLHYLSAITREELDCDARAYRRAGVFYYARNDLQDKEVSFTALNDDTTWKPAIPGTEGDAMLIWGCPVAAAPVAGADSKSARSAKRAAGSSAPDAAPSSAPAPATDLHTVR
jgi:hypothetical protein